MSNGAPVANETDPFITVTGANPALLRAINTAREASKSDSTVLLRGESGTGKEVFARAIHKSSARHAAAFVAVNCGALPESLIESELFGYEKGTFTGGSASGKRGLFDEADGGTVFLDEIGEMPLLAQVRLLRVLESGEVRRVGATESRFVNVRVIAATHVDLWSASEAGRFRKDLYYRLNVISIEIPALRDRREDILPLTEQFLRANLARVDRPEIVGFEAPALRALISWDWPGNVRELENVVERAVVLARGREIRLSDLPSYLSAPRKSSDPESAIPEGSTYRAARARAMIDFDRRFLSGLLTTTKGNLAHAAKLAGLDRANFRKIVLKSGINPRDFREQK